ncbi:MAG: cupin domain-containing protein [Mariprofundus sp.]|nr:cupin domain-containing protein [Mariprofundus sp.]
MMEPTNLFTNTSVEMNQEVVERILHGKTFRLERIVSNGQCSEQALWYDQKEDELVFLLSGEARLQFECDDTLLTLKPGDYVHIPAHQRHRLDWTSPDEASVWLALFFKA